MNEETVNEWGYWNPDIFLVCNLLRAGQYKEALEKFDSVLGAKPEYNEEAVANYNVACCYSKLNEVDNLP